MIIFPFQPFSSQAPGQALRLARGAGRANHSEILRQHAERFWNSRRRSSAWPTLVLQVAVDKCAIYYAIYSAQHQTRFHVLSIGKLFATQALSQTQKNFSEPQTGIEPATFWSPALRCSNHWATRTQMTERRVDYDVCWLVRATFVLLIPQSRYVCICY